MADAGDDIPNFLMLEQIPANYVQQIETDLLEPVVFQQGAASTDGFCRFTLQNKGFLHSHSKIFVALEPNASVHEGYLQPHVGIGQIIKKAVLKIGNKTLNELDSWSSLHAVKSSTITNENNFEREMFTTGRWLSHEFEYNAGSRFLLIHMVFRLVWRKLLRVIENSRVGILCLRLLILNARVFR